VSRNFPQKAMNRVEIYYFSGTGNSLHVARELQRRIPGTNLKPIVSLLRSDVIVSTAEIVGFVFPIYLTRLPAPVANFIKKLELASARYVFAIATRAGSPHRAFDVIDKILKKQDKSFNSYFTLNMGANYLGPIPTQEEITELESAVQERLESIHHVVINREKHREKDNGVTVPLPPLMVRLYPMLIAIAEHAPQTRVLRRFKVQWVRNVRNGVPVAKNSDDGRKTRVERRRPVLHMLRMYQFLSGAIGAT
jgi:hypothetical protein